MVHISYSQEQINSFCRENNIKKMAFFGSVLRDDFGPESDVDILVEFEPGRTPGLKFFTLQQKLSEILGKKVDLNTPAFISEYFREGVMQEAQILYD